MNHTNPLPVAVIGAGPVGLAAAAHLISRGLEPLIFEAGDAQQLRFEDAMFQSSLSLLVFNFIAWCR